MPSMAAQPLVRSAFSFMILKCKVDKGTSGEAEVEVASDGVREETEHQTNHGSASVELFSLLVMCLVAVSFCGYRINIHTRLFSPHVLLSLIIGGNSHQINVKK